MQDAKVLLITGASRGIGKQLALAAAGAGFSVVINYLSRDDEARQVLSEIKSGNGRAVAVKADISESDDVDYLVKRTMEQFGQIDCVINNAGVGNIVSLDDLDAAEFEKTLKVNLLSAFLVSQASILHIKPYGGRLIFMSSNAARTGGMMSAAYAASKAGLYPTHEVLTFCR